MGKKQRTTQNTKITRIVINGLHDEYNYDVKFDEKLTFLYGENGCGKTTILNILTAVVTGNLHALFAYSFSSLTLYYLDGEHIKDEQKIYIKKNKNNMNLEYENEQHTVKYRGLPFDDEFFGDIEEKKIEILYRRQYPFTDRIKNLFNYVYLPLNRFGMDLDDENEIFRIRRKSLLRQDIVYNAYLNSSLNHVSTLINNHLSNVSIQENKINDSFRREVLTSLVKVSSDIKFDQSENYLNLDKWGDIEKSKEEYKKILRDIDAWDDTINKQLEIFFNEIQNLYNSYQNSDKHSVINTPFYLKYAELIKIRKITELAKKYEKKKKEIRKLQEVFIEVINDFFGRDKELLIENFGEIYFISHGKKLDLKDLSSGEKQIIIIFSSLIFGLEDAKAGIYIVDEPEASLHLAWQNKFVPSILKINKDIQLIFATHSPELIGRYTDKAVKLVRTQETNYEKLTLN